MNNKLHFLFALICYISSGKNFICISIWLNSRIKIYHKSCFTVNRKYFLIRYSKYFTS
jgi:hypothetical protein